ncbi:MAG: hypothetical protein QM426_10155 [Euryarchaeota archaeon]|nr:hypothetical protein [Euryarchaeota archaeon]
MKVLGSTFMLNDCKYDLTFYLVLSARFPLPAYNRKNLIVLLGALIRDINHISEEDQIKRPCKKVVKRMAVYKKS